MNNLNVKSNGDPWVLNVQNWLNETYSTVSGWGSVPEDGRTGWPTIYGIIKAVQHELGITSLANNFGVTTQAKWDAKISSLLVLGTKHRIIKLIDAGMICKGMGTGAFSEEYTQSTKNAILQFKYAAGVNESTDNFSSMWAKALFDMSAFSLVYGGSLKIQQVQMYLNQNYNRYTGILPCDGIYQRETNKALIYALQAEMGMSTSVANGFFGEGTTANCPTLSPSIGSKNNIAILQAALIVNEEYSGNLDGIWTSSLSAAVKNYKNFMNISPVNDTADMPVIKALLTTTGDTSRKTTACDTSYPILTMDQINILKNAGYNTIGRYLTGTVGIGSNERPKNLTIPELKLLEANNFKVFPIYQNGGASLAYFSRYGQGINDAVQAGAAAKSLGFKNGTTIYFACDFDVLGDEIPVVVSYLRDVVHTMQSKYPEYGVSLYAPRNVCTQAMNSIIQIQNCFVSDMSSGFSANLGYKMPKNWSFDQFFEYSLGGIDIDKVGVSGYWDSGQSSFEYPTDAERLLELEEAKKISIAKKITESLPLFKENLTTEFSSEIEQTAVVGNIVLQLKISNSIDVFDGKYAKFKIENGKPELKFQEDMQIVQDLIDLTGGNNQVVDIVNRISEIMNNGNIQISMDINDAGAIGVLIKSTGKDTIRLNNEPINYNYSVSLGIYFDPRELPPGLSPELDRYKIQIEEFDRRFSLAVGLGVGLTPVAVLGFLGLSGIVATQGVLQGIAAILATMIAFFEETFKD
ncbi:glycoside hydrolase domain-containing protein [Enterococcus casseliflavus]|uniref:glycoside hydrolase domain-containing protein n=1 Tax=Enterococcus casseliflavus TaxID=37734 RepID=UPI0039A5870A